MAQTHFVPSKCAHGEQCSALECEYSCSHHTNRAVTPQQVIDDYLSTMQKAYEQNQTAVQRKMLNVPYNIAGTETNQNIDFYGIDQRAISLKGRQLIAFVHGGYWLEGSRQLFTTPVGPLCAADAVVASVGYDLAPIANVAQQVQQICEAIKFLHNFLERKAGGHLVLVGHSAGAHLITQACVTLWQQGCDLSRLKHLVPVSGIYDLRPLVNTYIGNPVGLSMSQAEQYSPIDYTAELAKQPIDISVVVGDQESDTFIDNSRSFIERLRAYGADKVELMIVPNTDHFTIVQNLQQLDFSFTQFLSNALASTRYGKP